MGSEHSDRPTRPTRLRRILRVPLYGILGLALLAMTAWGTLFLWFASLPMQPLRMFLAGLFALGTLAAFILVRRRGRVLAGFLAVFALLVTWFLSIPPSNDRNWAPEVAVLPSTTVEGSRVTIHDVRNFDYRSETDFTVRYEDRTYDLDELRSADLLTVYWGSPAIAHVIASFGFSDGEHIAFSIEMRKEAGEAGSMLRSFFRGYELIYIAADERDLIRVRTNFRNPREQVYLFRTRLPIEDQRLLFLSYAQKIDELQARPEWYNTIDDNCTTGVLKRTRVYRGRARYNWKVLLSGYASEYAYELGMFDPDLTYAELRERGLVNPRAEQAGADEDFSSAIRAGVPLPPPMTLQEFEADS